MNPLLERTGDLGRGNAGMLFSSMAVRPDYVPWTHVEQVDFDRAPAMCPTLGGRRSRAANSSDDGTL